MSITFESAANAIRERSVCWHANDTEPWILLDWSNAMAGEAGEACNAVKKLRRIQTGSHLNGQSAKTLEEARYNIAREIGDTIIYAFHFAEAIGWSLEDCLRESFNRVSEKNGFPHRI